MDEDSDEEDRVEVGDSRARALAEAPRQAHRPVGDVVLLRKQDKGQLKRNAESEAG